MADLYTCLSEKGINITSNRVIVLKTLAQFHAPLSLGELEAIIGTMEKSSILRVLNLFLAHHLVHTVEDGRGIVKYEFCNNSSNCAVNDMHVHFYCFNCNNTFCLEEIPVPPINLPQGYVTQSVNYVVKGICPSCRSKVSDK